MTTRIGKMNRMMKQGFFGRKNSEIRASKLSPEFRYQIAKRRGVYVRFLSRVGLPAATSCLLMLAMLAQTLSPAILASDKRPQNARYASSAARRRLAPSLRSGVQDFTAQETAVEAAIVRHLGSLNGRIEGTVRQLNAEDVTLNGNAVITSALLIPGTPSVQLNGNPTFGGTVQGTGSPSPSNHRVTLNGGVTLGRLVNRVDEIPMPTVAAPPATTGTRDVTLNNANDKVGDFATVRDLTLNGNVGNIVVPPGAYRTFTANGSGSFTFGVAGSSQPAVYNLSELRLNGAARLQVVGPVVVTLASGGSLNGTVGASSNPLWLTLKIASGGLTLNGGVSLYGVVQAPSGTIIINGNSLLQGNVACDRLTINGNGTLKGTPGVLTAINPTSAVQGQTLTVSLRGVSTHWLNGTTRASFGGEVSVGGAAEGEFGPVQVLDSFTAVASIVVSSTAALAPRTVKVLTPVSSFDEGETEVLIDAFTVAANSAPGAATAMVSTLAGNGTAGFSNGSATQAQFRNPGAISAGAGDTLYVADSGNHSIREIAPDGTVTTLAGNGSAGFADGNGAAARFNSPQGIAVDSTGVVFVADTGNNRIRRIGSDGTVTTIAGTGAAGLQNGPGSQATFKTPQGIALDNTGGLYIADTGNHAVRYLAASGDVSTLAGDGTVGSSDTPARFNNPIGVAFDGATLYVYLGDSGNHRIRRMTAGGNVITIAGAGRGFADGTASQARFADPSGLALDGAGKLIVADATNSLVRMIDVNKAISGAAAVTTIAGTGARGLLNGAGNVAKMFTPRGVWVLDSSAMIIADTGNNVIRKITLPPSINALSPAQAQAGQTIIIDGERFDARATANNTVNFVRSAQAGGGQTQAQVVNVTRTQLTVVVPSDAATGSVTAQTEGGTAVSPSVFTLVVPPPVITDFNPKSGPVGTQVTITGTNLTSGPGNPSVTFAGADGARLPALVSSATAMQLIATVPNAAVTGFIELTNANGAASTSQVFTVQGGPLSYQLTLAPTVASAVQHTSATYIVYATGSSSAFSQMISLSVSGLPGGVAATFEPAQMTAGAQSTLTLDLSSTNLSPGGFAFTVNGSALIDGSEMLRSVSGSLTVVAAGQTTLSGRVLSTTNEPVMGATASLDGKSATTDAAGSFLLSGVSAGVDRAVMIDGRTAAAPNRTYPIIIEPATVIAGQANIVPFTFYLPPIDTQYDVTVVPNQDTVVTTPRVPGIVATIPAGANLRNRDGSPVTRVSITPVPIDRTPAPLPANVSPSMVFTIQPGGALSDLPVPITYPNLAGADPGVRVELYAFDHDLVKWYVYGYGRVSNDGRRIEPEIDPSTGRPYGLRTFAWYFPNTPGPNTPFSNTPIANNGGNPAEHDCGNKTGNPVDLSSGVKLEPMIDIAFGGARGGISFGRVYSTDLARSGIIGRFGLGIRDSFDISLTGAFGEGGSGRLMMPEEMTGRLFSYVSKDADGTLNFTTLATTKQLGDVLKKFPDGTYAYRYVDGEVMRFDENGRLTSLADANGNTTTLTYTGTDLTKITDPVGRSITLEYTQSRISKATDSFGRVWSYTYNTRGQVATVTDPLNNILRYNYIVSSGLLSQVIDKRGAVVKTLSYDSSSRLIQQQLAGGMIQRYDYTLSGNAVTTITITDSLGRKEKRRFNSSGHTIEMEDALGQVTRIERDLTTELPTSTIGPCGCGEAIRQFDDRGNVTAVTDRLGQTVRMEYEDVFNQITRITDQLGRITRFGYDNRGNLTSMTDALGQSTVMLYDQYGQLTSVSDPLGHTRRFEYDNHGNITAALDALNHRTTMEYDNIGRMTAVVDALDRRSTMTYDTLGRMLTVIDPANATTTMDYDANGNLIRATKANGSQVQKGYDAGNRLVALIDAMGNIGQVEYDSEDQITALVSPGGRRTTYSYDDRGQVTTVTDPLLGVTHFTYDNRGNLIAMADQRGSTTTYSYDELYRRVAMRDALGRESRVTYDAVGNILESLDRLGRRVTRSYDSLNRLTSAGYDDASVSYSYDAASRPTRIDDTRGGFASWTYDDANRVLTETTGAGAIGYVYNAVNQVTQMTAADRAPVNYDYDAAGRLQTLRQGTESFAYSYDLISRLISLQRPNGVTTSYEYDDNSRLAHLLHQNGDGDTLEEYFYTYTTDGEIETVSSLNSLPVLPQAANASAANAGNRITQSDAASYTFDAVGQTTSKTDASGKTTYNWDARGRMTSASLPDGQKVSYAYDALGRRASMTANGSTTSLLYDGADVVLDSNGDGSTVDYLNGPGIDDKLRQRSSTSPGAHYFLKDHLGSTIALTDSDGNVEARQVYEPFGASAVSGLTRYGYTGRELDPTTGLLFYRARWYDPHQGRFISEDPMGGMNQYAYAGNNPLSNIDPLGTSFSTFMQGFTEGLAFGALSGFAISVIVALIGGTGGIPGAILLGISLGGLAVEVFALMDELNATDMCSDDKHKMLGRFLGGLIGGTLGGLAGENLVARVRANSNLPPQTPEGTCFAAGTKVATPDGEKNIEDIKAGDEVLSADPEGGAPIRQKVTQVYRRESAVLLDLNVGGETITTTPEHPFWVEGKGWIGAGELKVGARLITRTGKDVRVEAITRREGRFAVYNLEVGNLHTYFVSGLGVLVHNDYRARKLADEPPPADMQRPQVHHDLPQKFADQFDQADIDIHDPEHTRWVEGGHHQSWSAEFNNEWDNFFHENPNASRQEILQFKDRMSRDPRFSSRK